MTIGEYLFFKDEKNKISAKAMNLLSGRTCESCSHHFRCKTDLEDTCWEYKEIDYNDTF